MSDTESIKTVAKVLGEFFKDEPEKIVLWLFTDNPHFGSTTPAWLMTMKPEKAAKLIKALHGGDLP